MSIFNITDITAAGAFCNAMDAAWESDRRAARRRVSAGTDAAETPTPASILMVLRDALRQIARPQRAETA